jgi:hypothetical protein
MSVLCQREATDTWTVGGSTVMSFRRTAKQSAVDAPAAAVPGGRWPYTCTREEARRTDRRPGPTRGRDLIAERAVDTLAELVLDVRAGMIAGRIAQAAHPYPTWSVAVQQITGPTLRRRSPLPASDAVRTGLSASVRV